MKRQLLALLCMLTIGTYAQDAEIPTFEIGDSAPPLYVKEWVKGSPIQQMEKGHTYVVEFWATWCKPCIAAMPHLSELARQYRDQVTFIGVDIMETEGTPDEKIRTFVAGMGEKMDYHVAIDDGAQTDSAWRTTFNREQYGIPQTFIVDAAGRLAWVGHPINLDTVLQQIVDGEWNVDQERDQERDRRHEEQRISQLEEKASLTLSRFNYEPFTTDERLLVDSMLTTIGEIVAETPELKNTRTIVHYTFSALLRTNQKEAYEYGKTMLTATNQHMPIIDLISWFDDQLTILPAIYQLGAEAYQQRIDQVVYPLIEDLPRYYHEMANLYWNAHNPTAAIAAQQKAITAINTEGQYSSTDLATLEACLQQYKEDAEKVD